MDLVYMPEVLTYGSFRAPAYRDYEQPWNKDYYGKSSSIYCPRQQQLVKSPPSKDSCHLCKESKRRTLASYLRGKSRLNSCSEEIHEEEDQVPDDKSSETVDKGSKSQN